MDMGAIGWVMIAYSSNCLISQEWLASIAEGDSIINATLLYLLSCCAPRCQNGFMTLIAEFISLLLPVLHGFFLLMVLTIFGVSVNIMNKEYILALSPKWTTLICIMVTACSC